MTFALSILLLINAHRDFPLELSQPLSVTAQTRAEYLCARNQWSHAGWGQQFWGHGSTAIGENLYRGPLVAKTVVKAWYKSPSHKKTMTEPMFKVAGIGQSCGIVVLLLADKFK